MKKIAILLLVVFTAAFTAQAGAAPVGKGSQKNSYVLNYGPHVLDQGGYRIVFDPSVPDNVRAQVNTSAATASRASGVPIGESVGNASITILMTTEDVCGNACAYSGFDGVHMVDSTIKIESWSFPQEYAPCLAVHELGHALGLGHVNDPRQIMNATWTPGKSPCTWAQGDLEGLKQAG